MFARPLALLIATPVVTFDVGPEPTMEAFTAMVEPVLATGARDPKAVTFEWPYRLIAGPAGYYTCGRVKTYKGKAPSEQVWVSARIGNGKVLNTDWSTKNGMLAWECKRMVKSGKLIAR